MFGNAKILFKTLSFSSSKNNMFDLPYKELKNICLGSQGESTEQLIKQFILALIQSVKSYHGSSSFNNLVFVAVRYTTSIEVMYSYLFLLDHQELIKFYFLLNSCDYLVYPYNQVFYF